ncbi:MAG: dihydrodipicolinate synthase family protein [Verrucomicrobiales bacterium]|jgi:dihydrodipicolinate synthase/N-acetylneuraminate lyase|nr:dihydrodipicolinate synthase family protein [Verrucomicrobiales bacterium]MDP4938135.1 dihydrodipicolinate synthase family protein [Verrucomicrobiales bacterium]MDP5004684.1 dihydrodipicolinate synthase family protein [Verrucomicrobiales bacterium]
MQTRTVTTADLARSVIAVPPMARDKDLKFDRAENEKILRHIEAGQVTTMLYGGNANFYHIAPSEYESVLGQLAEIAAADTLVIPSAGPSYGVMMDQAEILKGTAYPTVMVLPHQGITTSQGVVAGLRNFAQKVGKPIVLYIKYGDYISVEGAKELVDEGLVSWIKYAIVREDPANDPYLAQLVDVVDPALIVSGIGEQPVIEHLVDFGVNGFTAGCVCIRPELSDQLLKAVQAKDLTRAREIQAIFEPLEDLRNGINPIRVLHEAVRLAGIAETGPALPLLSGISEVQTEEVKAAALTLLHANG